MADYQLTLISRAPFAGLLLPTHGPNDLTGVKACHRDGMGIATILARKGQNVALAERMLTHFRIELPHGPYRTNADDHALAGTGAGTWLATHERGGNAFAISLREKIGDLASVSDQSDGYAVLQVWGPKVYETLAKMLPIDLHPNAFKPGDVAVSVVGHIGATLWRPENHGDGTPAFEIAVYRSFAMDFCRFLSESAAQFGLGLALVGQEPLT